MSMFSRSRPGEARRGDPSSDGSGGEPAEVHGAPETQLWQRWRQSAQRVTRTWNAWRAAEEHDRPRRYEAFVSALGEEEMAAAAVQRATGCSDAGCAAATTALAGRAGGR